MEAATQDTMQGDTIFRSLSVELLVSMTFILKTWLIMTIMINLQVVVGLLRGLQLKERTTVSNAVEKATALWTRQVLETRSDVFIVCSQFCSNILYEKTFYVG